MSLKDFIKLCACKKDGLSLTEPNSNLCSAYFGMAHESLESMEANIKAGVKRWAIVAAYYARYHAVYAIFMKIGIKCEIHDCTLATARFLLNIRPELMKDIEKAKTQRINMQYYADRTVTDNEYERNVKAAAHFVIAMEGLASKLTNNDIKNIRNKLELIIKS